jgi:hypothetical protein
MAEPVTSSTVEMVELRRCGRCRQQFPGDPTLPTVAHPDWWVCPPCHDALFGPEEQPC